MGQTGVCGPSPMNGRGSCCDASPWARGTGAQDTHSNGAPVPGFAAPSIRRSPSSLCPSHPFTNPTSLCTLNSSEPVKAPNPTRRDLTPFSLNLPQVELTSPYTSPFPDTLPSLHPSRMLLWEKDSLYEAQLTTALHLLKRAAKQLQESCSAGLAGSGGGR